MTSVLIRCDASLTIGSGHVMRCRTLGRELQRRGTVVVFACRRQSGDLISLLEQDFSVLPLPEQPLLPSEELSGRELYGAWLGCSQEQDAADCLKALQSAGISHIDWFVVDHYGLDASWESLVLAGQAGKAPSKLLVIDDLADREHQADLLLDQNFFGVLADHRYESLVSPMCRQLLGPHYALLGPEYPFLYPLVPERREVRRVLVFFGGVDPCNLTGRTLEALMDPELAHLSVDVVLGHQALHRQQIADLVGQRPFTTLHSQLPSLAGLIARADVAIGAGGSTTWERACLRLPSLVVASAANQVPFAEALHEAGHHQLLGCPETLSEEKIRSAVQARITDAASKDGGCDLTDGFGASRLALAVLGRKVAISLRPADSGDEALLLRWANDPQVRANSFSPDLISSSNHHDWFREGLANHCRLLLIASTSDGCPIGQIRFDLQPPIVLSGPAVAKVDFSLDRCIRGYGLAVELLRLGLQAMEQKWGSDIEVLAEVMTTNAASNACFSRAGFVKEPISPLKLQVSLSIGGVVLSP